MILLVAVALAEEPPATDPAMDPAAGVAAFLDVARVLQSPRCMNCHPAGDAPLQRDVSLPHAMNVTRHSPEAGLPCATCHREVGLGLPGLPPASPVWHLPPANQVFEGRAPRELCLQLKDPATTGGRDLPALLHHVEEDALVLWGWSPGGGRTVPPLSHEAFVERFRTWIEAGAPCPE